MLDTLFWLRVIIGVVVGSGCGIFNATGYSSFMIYVTVTILFVQIYYQIYLHIDDEEYGKWALMTEALLPSTALFVVIWTTIYTINNQHLLTHDVPVTLS